MCPVCFIAALIIVIPLIIPLVIITRFFPNSGIGKLINNWYQEKREKDVKTDVNKNS